PVARMPGDRAPLPHDADGERVAAGSHHRTAPDAAGPTVHRADHPRLPSGPVPSWAAAGHRDGQSPDPAGVLRRLPERPAALAGPVAAPVARPATCSGGGVACSCWSSLPGARPEFRPVAAVAVVAAVVRENPLAFRPAGPAAPDSAVPA